MDLEVACFTCGTHMLPMVGALINLEVRFKSVKLNLILIVDRGFGIIAHKLSYKIHKIYDLKNQNLVFVLRL